VTNAEREPEYGDEHQVTPLELFFDLVFVFAMTQVTSLLADDPTWSGVLRGMLVLAALWWAWEAYAWLTSAMDVDEGGVRLVMLASMGAMLVVALAVPAAFGDDAVLFGVACLLVRLLHLDGKLNAAFFAAPEAAASHWRACFTVESTEKALQRVCELGGQQLSEPTDIGHGTIAMALDPHGALFRIFAGETDA
jgi:hypothetical protein